MRENKKDFKRKLLLIVFFSALSAVFLSVFSLATSFLYENKFIGWDSDIFLAMGKFAKEGLVPYKEFFDHKGPFIIFIEWLGYLIGERSGVFLIQIIFLTISLAGVYKILRLYCGKKASLVLTTASLLVLNMYFDKGNLTEEFCLPFLVWSMYLAVKAEKLAFKGERLAERKGVLAWKGIQLEFVLYGVTFMIGAMTRLTNSLPIVVILVCKIISLIENKQWRKLCSNLLWFVVGNLIVFVPVTIYFVNVGALKEMLYATFIYNFKHGFERNALTGREMVNMAVLAVPLVIAFITGIAAMRTKGEVDGQKAKGIEHVDMDRQLSTAGRIVFTQSVVAIVLLIISRPYAHYLMVWFPVIVLGIALLSNLLSQKKALCIVMFTLLGVAALGKAATACEDIYSTLNSNVCQIFDAQAKEVVSEIPENEVDKVIAYNVKSRFYLVTDILPCYKNFVLQGLHARMDDVERAEFENDLKSLEAKYIVTGTSDSAYSQFIEKYYRLEKSTQIFRLFVRK